MKNIRENIPDYMGEYISYLKIVKSRLPRTVEEYVADISLFLRFMRKRFEEKYETVPVESIPIKDLSIDILRKITLYDIYEFIFYLLDGRGNKERARARKTSALKSFFKYLTNNTNLLEVNPIANIEMPTIKRPLPKFLSLDESLRLLSNIKSPMPERDYCIVTLFLNCGMRLSELVGLNINSIDFKERRMKLHGKGNKERIIYINDACIAALDRYLKVRGTVSEEPYALFLSKQKRRITGRRVQQIVADALSDANLSGLGFSPHKLRHTAATLMYQYGGSDMLVLKEILGHESITTTEIYTHLSNTQLEEAANNTPLAGVKKV